MKLFYFSDVRKLKVTNTLGENDEIDCGALTVMERFFFSVYASSLLYHPNKKLSEIIFDYKDSEIYTSSNFKDYDDTVTKCIKEHPLLLSFIKNNIGKRDEKGEFVLIGRDIDNSEVFASKNGNKAGNGKTSPLNAIAVKTFILAASKRKKKQADKLSMLNIFNWSNASLQYEDYKNHPDTVDFLKKNASHKENIKTSINKWANKAGFDIEIDGNMLFVKGRKPAAQVKNSEAEVKVKSVESIAQTDKDIELEEVHPAIEFNYDESDDFNLYSPEDYIQYYENFCERKFGDELNKKSEYVAKLKKYWGSPEDMAYAIAKRLNISSSDFQNFIVKNYINGEDGLLKKEKLTKNLKDLKNKIMNAPDDDSWLLDASAEKVKLHGHNLIGLAYKTCKWMSRV